MNDEKKNDSWKEKVRQSAIQFAQTVHMNFNAEMKKTLKLLPIDAPETRIQQLNSYMDTMVGVTVAVACEYAGTTLDVEEQFIKLARAKFQLIRRAQFQISKGIQ